MEQKDHSHNLRKDLLSWSDLVEALQCGYLPVSKNKSHCFRFYTECSLIQSEKEKNLQPILDYLSPYVISTVTVESDNTTIITSLQGKKSHENFLKNSFATLKNETDINSYSNIKITEDGQMASVTRVQGTDVVTEDGKKYLSVSTDKIHFALIDNEPKIINVEVKGWLQERP